MPDIITIGREYGSGGSKIAKALAGALQIPFYDKKLIEIAAKETGLSEEFIQEAEQHRTSSFLYNLSFSSRNLPVSDQVFIAEADVIKRVAAEGPCVIVGRCANYVLREQKTACAFLSMRLWRTESAAQKRSTASLRMKCRPVCSSTIKPAPPTITTFPPAIGENARIMISHSTAASSA